MKRLQSRRRVRFTPTVEALEDRSLLSATLNIFTGQVVTTGAVNHVLITDDGQFVRVFSDNGFVGFLDEGTPVTVTTNSPGSNNTIFYDLDGQGDPTTPGPGPVLKSSLNVNFGFGPGALFVAVVSGLPNGLFAPAGAVSGLVSNSSVQVITTTTPPPARRLGPGLPFQFVLGIAGNTQESLNVGNIGLGASLVMKDFGGAGNDSFTANLSGVQLPGSGVVLTFFGNGGNDSAHVIDSQLIAGQDLPSGRTAAGTFIDMHGGPGNDGIGVVYTGQLLGTLQVSEDGGPGNDSLDLTYAIASGSNGSLFSAQQGGPDNDFLLHIIRVAPGNAFPFIQASTDGGPGLDKAAIGPGFVRLSNVEQVIPITS
jgi:hypothetical protein